MRTLLLLSLVGVTLVVMLLTATQCAHADDAADESTATDETAASTLDNDKVSSPSNDGDDSKISKLGKRDGVEIRIENRGQGQQNSNRDKSDDHSDNNNNNNNQNNYQNNDNNHNDNHNNDNKDNDYNNNNNRKSDNDNHYNYNNNNDNDGWRDGDDDNSNNKHGSYQSEEAKPVRPYNEPKPVYVEKKVVYEKEEPVRPYQQPVKVYQEEKKVYVQSSNAYDNGPSHSGLAEVIPASQSQQTLDQIYKKQPQNAYERPKAYLAYQSASQNNIPQNVRQDILLLLKFPRDFDQWNPRNNNSQWQWGGSPADPQDNAAFVVHNGNQYSSSARNNYDGGNKYKAEYNSYGKQREQPVYKKKDDSYVDLISVPFNRFTPQNDDSYNEGAVVSKAYYTIGDRQRFLARLKFSCHIVNADQHPFPANLVANPWDDPRLANCFFSLHAPLDDNTTLLFYFTATNTGVWAVTLRSSDNGSTSSAQNYIAKRRVGVRPRYDSLVDAAIEVDRLQSVVNFYLNGYRVWTVYTIGVPPSADGITSVNLGQGTPTIATVTSVQVAFGTAKCLDEIDPNNQASRTRLVNIAGADSVYYGANDTFYDNDALRNNQVFGQGASERLFKLLLVRADSVLPAQIALPGVYGPKAPEYQQYNNEYRHDNNDEYNRKK